MKKKVIVISLGGSLIIPNKIDEIFLEKFKKILIQNKKKYKFVVICGGGKTARNYIKGLENQSIKQKMFLQGFLGICTTRLNARFLTYFFGRDANQGIPRNMRQIKNLLKHHNFVFCGALRYAKNETSDGTSAKLAHYFNTIFINLTNISGLYNKNPKKSKNAEFIPEISYKAFLEKAKKIKFKPGQHFVLDQNAAKIIKKYKIATYILGPDLKNLSNLLNHKHYIGTRIGSIKK